ncbi:DUF1289 domain-containing protein [Sphingobium wenxiniae]|uniref:DUF1289 domain-containing protein n=1 Tax=Sphingobium wenxiniae (strain DSM 21828 / CGMCC 1.7748 / JZ-1) TaxID=595605 RepID=UPI0011A9A12E|nr:DUF1289 domain-containing protein [Sphingobium wenxiniae]
MNSPCIGRCSFDGRTGWCRGCGRTTGEIRGRKRAQPHQRPRIASDLPRRLAKLAASGKVRKLGE